MTTRIFKGFTLIELLIVIAILGLLSVLGIGNFHTALIKARDTTRKSDLSTIAKSLEAYMNDHREYPPSATLVWGLPFTDPNGTIYTAKLPIDPGSFSYKYVKSGATYTLYAHLENTEDPKIFFPATNGCGGTEPSCNYKITSSNL